MKGLHKRIGSMLLAIVIVMGISLSSVNALSMKDFAIQEGFDVLAKKESKEDINKVVKDILSKMNLLKRLRGRLIEEEAVPINSMEEFINLRKSGKHLHKIRIKNKYYLIRFDEESIYGAKRVPSHKFNDRLNQRIYDILEFYSKKQNYNIILVKDSSYYGGRIELESLIRGIFKNQVGVMKKLLKGPDKNIKDIDLLRKDLKAGKNALGEKGYHRVKIKDLEFIIEVK